MSLTRADVTAKQTGVSTPGSYTTCSLTLPSTCQCVIRLPTTTRVASIRRSISRPCRPDERESCPTKAASTSSNRAAGRSRLASAKVERRTGFKPRCAWLPGKPIQCRNHLAQRPRPRQLRIQHRQKLGTRTEGDEPGGPPRGASQAPRNASAETPSSNPRIPYPDSAWLGLQSELRFKRNVQIPVDPSHAPCPQILNRTAMEQVRV